MSEDKKQKKFYLDPKNTKYIEGQEHQSQYIDRLVAADRSKQREKEVKKQSREYSEVKEGFWYTEGGFQMLTVDGLTRMLTYANSSSQAPLECSVCDGPLYGIWDKTKKEFKDLYCYACEQMAKCPKCGYTTKGFKEDGYCRECDFKTEDRKMLERVARKIEEEAT